MMIPTTQRAQEKTMQDPRIQQSLHHPLQLQKMVEIRVKVLCRAKINQMRPKDSSKVMEAAMKEKVQSSFVANPLIGLPNEDPHKHTDSSRQRKRSLH